MEQYLTNDCGFGDGEEKEEGLDRGGKGIVIGDAGDPTRAV